ncbi:MAG: hypothetical protein CK519_00680 [Opitutia bacterium]|nr:MAG: hypothetical protein CK519_00680 [Opitutae bacterium]
MRNKTLLVGTLVLGLITLVVLNFNKSSDEVKPVTKPLIDNEILNRPARLVIKSGGKTSTIEQLHGLWVVKERFDLPADIENRLLPLIASLQKTENFGLLTSNPKRLEKLNLSDALILITGENGKTFAAEIGKPTDDALGNAMRIQGETSAIRTNFTGYIEADPATWINPILYSIKPEEVKSVTFKFADGKTVFVRSAKDKKFNDQENPWLEDFVLNLATLRITDAQGKGITTTELAFKQSSAIIFDLFEGESITTTWAKETNPKSKEPKYFVRVQHSDPKNKINQVGQKAEFLCPSWLMEQIPTSTADLNKRLSPPTENTK